MTLAQPFMADFFDKIRKVKFFLGKNDVFSPQGVMLTFFRKIGKKSDGKFSAVR